jgi:hypothetical protein
MNTLVNYMDSLPRTTGRQPKLGIDSRTVALHEAGHAVMAHHNGHRIVTVSSKPVPGIVSAGGCTCEVEEPTTAAEAHKLVLTVLAGDIAAELHGSPSCSMPDVRLAEALCAEWKLGGVPYDATAEIMNRQCKRMAVERLADALQMADRPLDGNEVDRIIEGEI